MIQRTWDYLESHFAKAARPVRLIELLVIFLGLISYFVKFEHHPEIATRFVCSVCVVFMILFTVEEFRWHRKARFAESQPWIHQAHHSLRDASWAVQQGDAPHNILNHLQTSLTAFAAAWSLITGADCRACIVRLYCADKNANPPDGGFCVEPLCRHEDTPRRQGAPDKLTDNSDFLRLWSDHTQRWFYSNDLTKEIERGYRNSHWSTEAVLRDEIDYVAACVWPIRKTLPAMSTGAGRQAQDLIGYLCIDSSTRGIFSRRYDFDLGAGFADSLYAFLVRWRQLSGFGAIDAAIKTENKQAELESPDKQEVLPGKESPKT